MSVIAASLSRQASLEMNGHGVFTAAVLDALKGGAADHLGWVTASSIYAYVERRFSAFDQRPVYKSYATNVRVVRQCAALIDRLKLNALVGHFDAAEYLYRLDPEHEPEDEFGRVHEPINEVKVAVAKLFKEYRDAGLLKPSLPGEQLYWTARRGIRRTDKAGPRILVACEQQEVMRIGVTGHQRLPHAEDWHWVRRNWNVTLPLSGSLIGITSLAIGADQLFATTVLLRGGLLEIIIPFSGYEFTFSEACDRQEYHRLLLCAARADILVTDVTKQDAYLQLEKR